MQDEPDDNLPAHLATDRKSRDDLRSMWSDLARQDAADRAADLPTILEQADRHLQIVVDDIAALKAMMPRMIAAGMSELRMAELLGLLRGAEAIMRAFRDRVKSD